MAKKYYAVRAGRKTGIFLTWTECKEQVHGYPSADYKSFTDRDQAEAYLQQQGEVREKSAESPSGLPADPENLPADTVIAYVDGSYPGSGTSFSYGMVILKGDSVETFSGKITDASLSSMRNVAGEIKGAEAAFEYCLSHGYRHLILYYDYEGIARWPLGAWKTNKEGTIRYKEKYESVADRLKVTFCKVKGHSQDTYNDMADALAKKALGLLSDKEEKELQTASERSRI